MIAKKVRETQREFQGSLLGYIKLIEVLALLNPKLLPAVRDAYAEMVAEGILMSYMVLPSIDARAQFYMMIPLIVVTVLFEVYLLQRHFNVARRLSSEDCVKFDVRNDLNESTAKELFGRPYLQPALRAAQDLEMESNDEEEGRLASSY